jgi:hypothetical protein
MDLPASASLGEARNRLDRHKFHEMPSLGEVREQVAGEGALREDH